MAASCQTKGPPSPVPCFQLWAGCLERSIKAGRGYSNAFSERSLNPELVVQGLSAPKLNSSWLISFPWRVTFEHMCIFSSITSCWKLHYIVGEMSHLCFEPATCYFHVRPPSSCTGRNDKQWLLAHLTRCSTSEDYPAIDCGNVLYFNRMPVTLYVLQQTEKEWFMIILFLGSHSFKAETWFLYSTIKRT